MNMWIVSSVIGASAAVVPVAPTAAHHTQPVQIHRVQYNSPGTDNGSNASLNGEWVQLKNTTAKPRTLTGWKLKDKSGHAYTFGTFVLGPGKTVKIHTGMGMNTATDRYWGRKSYVWNNTGDKALLFNASGLRRDKCSWGANGSSKYC